MQAENYSVGMVLNKYLGDTPEKKQENLKRVGADEGGTLEVECSECHQAGLASMAMILEVMKIAPANKISYICVDCMDASTSDESPYLQVPTITSQSLIMLKSAEEKEQERFCKSVALTMISQGLNVTDDVAENEPVLKNILETMFEVFDDFFADKSVSEEDKVDTRQVRDIMKRFYGEGRYKSSVLFYTRILIQTHEKAYEKKQGGLD